MLFRIPCNPNAKIKLLFHNCLITKKQSLIHIGDTFNEFIRIGISPHRWYKVRFVCQFISLKQQEIINTEEMEVNQYIFYLLLCKASADYMRDGVNAELIKYCRADSYGPRPFSLHTLYRSEEHTSELQS